MLVPLSVRDDQSQDTIPVYIHQDLSSSVGWDVSSEGFLYQQQNSNDQPRYLGWGDLRGLLDPEAKQMTLKTCLVKDGRMLARSTTLLTPYDSNGPEKTASSRYPVSNLEWKRGSPAYLTLQDGWEIAMIETSKEALKTTVDGVVECHVEAIASDKREDDHSTEASSSDDDTKDGTSDCDSVPASPGRESPKRPPWWESNNIESNNIIRPPNGVIRAHNQGGIHIAACGGDGPAVAGSTFNMSYGKDPGADASSSRNPDQPPFANAVHGVINGNNYGGISIAHHTGPPISRLTFSNNFSFNPFP